jgi:hypothetical protein
MLTAITLITSCKKGANDPTISLRSRNARMEGKWNMKSFEANISESSNSSTNGVLTNTLKISGDGVNQTLTLHQNITANSGKITTKDITKKMATTLTLEIKKDQTFIITIVSANTSMVQISEPAIPNPNPSIYQNKFATPIMVSDYTLETRTYDETYNYNSNSNTRTITGNWSWENGAKNKTYIVLDGFGKFYIDALKNKNLTLTSSIIDDNQTANVVGLMESKSVTVKYTFEQ